MHGLQQLTLHAKEVPDEAFMYCTALTKVEFPQELDTIGTRAFQACNVKP